MVLRSLCRPDTGKLLFTSQQLADAFESKARQNVENVVAEFRASEKSFGRFFHGAARSMAGFFR